MAYSFDYMIIVNSYIKLLRGNHDESRWTHKIQAISGRFNVPESQNVVNEIPNQSQPVLLLNEGVDNSAADYDSNKLTFEQQLQGIYEVEFSCKKQSINSNDVESDLFLK